MTAPSLAPYPYFTDARGTALDGGKIYVGTANLDPRTNPITVYQDAASAVTWAQPLRTVAGYPAYQGAPSNIYPSAASYSIIVTSAAGTVLFRNLNVVGILDSAAIAALLGASGGAALIGTVSGMTVQSTIAPNAFIDFTTKVDGLPPSVLDTGQAVTYTVVSRRAQILSGRLVPYNPVGPGVWADYFQSNIGGNSPHVGCEWTQPATVTFTASFATTIMTVTGSPVGTLAVGQYVYGPGVASGTTIASLGTGTGGAGTYNLSKTQPTIPAVACTASSDDGTGAVTFGAWGGIYTAAGTNVPQSWLHMTVIPGTGATGQAQWAVCAGDGNARFRTVKIQTFANPPADGVTRWRMEAVLDLNNGTAYCRLPDGSVMTLTNAEIASFYSAVSQVPLAFAECSATPVIFWEHYTNTHVSTTKYGGGCTLWGETTASNLKPLNAKSGTLLDELRTAVYFRGLIPSLVGSVLYAPTVAFAAATTSSTANIDATNAVVSAVAGPSGTIIYDLAAYYDCTGTDTIFWRLVLNGGIGSTPLRVADLVVAGQKRVARCAMPISGLTPGQTYQATWQHAGVTGGLATMRAGGTGGAMVPPLTMIATPA